MQKRSFIFNKCEEMMWATIGSSVSEVEIQIHTVSNIKGDTHTLARTHTRTHT